MALVLLAVVILLVIGVGLLSLGLHGRSLAERTSAGIAARCAADAGLTKAIFEMNEQLKAGNWQTYATQGEDSVVLYEVSHMLPNCDAAFLSSVTADGNDNYTIESIGSAGQAEHRDGKAECAYRGYAEFDVSAGKSAGPV